LETKKNKRIPFFEKQSREVVDNTGSGQKNKAEQTEKQSGELIENMFLWKKQTGNKPENKAGHVVENRESSKIEGKLANTCCPLPDSAWELSAKPSSFAPLADPMLPHRPPPNSIYN
jgi:hypothetical protein